MVKLKTEINRPSIEARVRAAFLVSNHATALGIELGDEDAPVSTEYEHGQWWVTAEDTEGTAHVFSVVDAVGGNSIDGFDFEEV